MSQRYEWAHAANGFELVDPDVLDDWAEDGNADREYGLAFSTGSNGCMIYGSLDDLHDLGARIMARVQAQAAGPHLSPGEWAGVSNVLLDAAAVLRRSESTLTPDEYANALELAVDYKRLADKIRAHLGA